MPSKCFVPMCRSGLPPLKGEEKPKEKIALFSVPKDEELFKKWSHAIPRQGKDLSRSSKVCSAHFEEDDILKGRYVGKGKEDKAIFYPWSNWSLRDGAIPRLFPGESLPRFYFVVACLHNSPVRCL